MPHTEQLNLALTGRYVIDRLVGEGGMATVYLARDLRHQRNVALKVLRPDLGAVLGLERFEAEIQVTANLQHPNLLPLFDSGAAGSLLFYVMPFVEGESLRARLDREKQLPVEEAVRIATAVGSALDYAHRHGVIHRDLKPENILLHDGQPLVADFGIALAVSKAGGNRVTQTGVSLGTPQYMSPEQATGDRAIDGRTDVYALGAVTYEMLTGEAPHTGSTSQAVIARVLTERPRPVRASRSSVPEYIDAAVDRALEKLPADRWATAKEFGEALTGTRVATRSTMASRSSAAYAGGRPPLREYIAWGLAAAAIAALAFVSLRPKPLPIAGVPAEFEVMLPDSLNPNPSGGAASIAVSRDGATIVFQARLAGATPALFVRRLGEAFVEKIRGSDSARSPVLSPDGSEVLFSPLGGGAGGQPGSTSLKRVPLRGGVARAVVDSAGGNGQASWGDAGLIVVAHRTRLWTVPEDGGTRTLLAAPDSSRGHERYGFPDVLPGGRAALIVIWKGAAEIDSARLGVVTIPEGRVTELAVRGSFPRYSSTGHIVYVTTDGSAFGVPFDAGSHRVTGPPALITNAVRVGSGGAAALGVGRGGTLAYLSGAPREERTGWRFVAVSRQGAERELNMPPGFHFTGRLSPDGKQIAVTTGTVAGWLNPDIWRFELDSRVLTRVTTDSSSVYPQWSADGERIAFAKMLGDTAVFWRPLYSAGQTTPLLRAADTIRGFTLGPAHGYAAFRVLPGNNRSADIWLVHQDSLGTPRPFLAEPYMETAPDLSRDGRLLAYTTNRTGRDEVYVRPVSGGPELQVSPDGGHEPKWGREAGELYYRGPNRMMAVRVAERPRLAVTQREPLFPDVYIRLGVAGNTANYDVFPGGKEFLMARAQQRERVQPALTVLLNWPLRVPAGGPDQH